MGGASCPQAQKSQHPGNIGIPSSPSSSPASVSMSLDKNPLKRKHAGSPSQSATDAENARTCKRRKVPLPNQPRRPQTLPDFWDSLSEIRLTRGALKEFDHRVLEKQPELDKPLRPGKVLAPYPQPNVLKRFARRGGPDLSHLRGFSASTMSSRSRNSRKRLSKSGGSAYTSNTKPSDSQYRGKIVQAGLYPHGYTYPNGKPDLPGNLDEILEKLGEPRPSLSPSRFTEGDFVRYQEDIDRADNEDQAWARAMATVEGRHKHYAMSRSFFNNIDKFRKDIADAVPDSYDGAVPETIDSRVLRDLNKSIVPCTDTSRPAVPNFSLEAKRANASIHVAKLQATHDGAIGARAMNKLQNYGQAVPTYDGNAYAFSNTYQDGLLRMYATHPTAPKAHREDPEYHMTQLKAYATNSDRETFLRGATAYRNIRDLSAANRDSFIEQANAVAQRMPADTPSSQIGSSQLTSGHMSRSAQPETDSDTSLDELAREEVTVKRSRRVPYRDPNATSSNGTRNAVRAEDSGQRPATALIHQRRTNDSEKPRRASTKILARPSPTRVSTKKAS